MEYPGRIIKTGEQDARIVGALKRQLNAMLGIADDPALRLDPEDPSFGPKTRQVVKLFQARHVDSQGQPLKQDGEVGSITWEALFGATDVPQSARPDSKLFAEALKVAAAEERKKVREVPKNSNSGPDVERYLKSVKLEGGYAWCCAFVYWCVDKAARSLDRENPVVRTAGCIDHWNRAPSHGAERILKRHAVQDPSLVRSGMIFILDHGRGLGHTGFVEEVSGGFIVTLEGNTDASLSREGGGVYRHRRKIVDINKGFIDYSGV